MTRNRTLVLAGALALVALAIIVVLLTRRHAEAEDAPEPKALVTVAAVRRQTVQQTVSVYGVVQADPAGSVTVAAPKAAIVLRMLARSGQPVAAGQALVELADAPPTEAAYRQAAGAAAAAEADLARVQRLYDQKLAASDQLIAARKTLTDAQASLQAQQRQGAGRARQTIAAPTAGVVTAVSAATGDHVAQDAPLVVLAREGALVAKLAVEPGTRLLPGQAVTLTPAFGGAPSGSRLTMVGRAADQTTKTIDALAPAPAGMPVGAPVKAEVAIGALDALLVPRASVVFDETGAHVFVVAGGKARRVFVRPGGTFGADLAVQGPLQAGAQVAVEGAYELQDGMAVQVRGR